MAQVDIRFLYRKMNMKCFQQKNYVSKSIISGGRAAEEILFKNLDNSSVYLNEVIFQKL